MGEKRKSGFRDREDNEEGRNRKGKGEREENEMEKEEMCEATAARKHWLTTRDRPQTLTSDPFPPAAKYCP